MPDTICSMARRAQLDRNGPSSIINRYAGWDIISGVDPGAWGQYVTTWQPDVALTIDQGSHPGHMPLIASQGVGNPDAVPFASIGTNGSLGSNSSNTLAEGSFGVAFDGTKSLRIPSNTDANCYTNNYDDDDGGGGLYSGASATWYYPIARTRQGQTWTVRAWFYNPHAEDVPIQLSAFGVDSYCNAFRSGHNGVSCTDNNETPATGGSWYKMSATLTDQNVWSYHSMTFTFGSFDWICGITLRVDNDYNGIDHWMYVDGWGLWRRNISMRDDINNNLMGGPYAPVYLSKHEYGHLVPQMWDEGRIDDDRGKNLKLMLKAGDRFMNQFSVTGDTAWSNSAAANYNGVAYAIKGFSSDNSRYFLIGSQTSNPGTGNPTPVNANWPSYQVQYGGFWKFDGSGATTGIRVVGDLGYQVPSWDPLNDGITISMWCQPHMGQDDDDAGFIFDARSGTGGYGSYGANAYFSDESGFYNLNVYGNSFGYNFPNTWKWRYMHIMITSTGYGDTNGCKIYINGVLKATGLGMGTDVGQNFVIGRSAYWSFGGANYCFEGLISDFCIYSEILTQAHAEEMFLAGLPRFQQQYVYDAS